MLLLGDNALLLFGLGFADVLVAMVASVVVVVDVVVVVVDVAVIVVDVAVVVVDVIGSFKCRTSVSRATSISSNTPSELISPG